MTKGYFWVLVIFDECLIYQTIRYWAFLRHFCFLLLFDCLIPGWQTNRSVLNSQLALLATLSRWFVFVFVFWQLSGGDVHCLKLANPKNSCFHVSALHLSTNMNNIKMLVLICYGWPFQWFEINLTCAYQFRATKALKVESKIWLDSGSLCCITSSCIREEVKL